MEKTFGRKSIGNKTLLGNTTRTVVQKSLVDVYRKVYQGQTMGRNKKNCETRKRLLSEIVYGTTIIGIMKGELSSLFIRKGCNNYSYMCISGWLEGDSWLSIGVRSITHRFWFDELLLLTRNGTMVIIYLIIVDRKYLYVAQWSFTHKTLFFIFFVTR